MKLFFAALLLLFSSVYIFAQEGEYKFDNFTVSVKNNIVLAKSSTGDLLYSRSFNNAKEFLADLDGDSLQEFCVIENKTEGANATYCLYVYNTVDTFFLADSLESLNVEPYLVSADELGQDIVVVGNPDILKIHDIKKESGIVPLDCYAFDGTDFLLANDGMYDFFMQTNEELLDSLDEFYENHPQDCANSQEIKMLIASIYINYLNANEDSMALHFLNKYYFCNDATEFKTKLTELIKADSSEEPEPESELEENN